MDLTAEQVSALSACKGTSSFWVTRGILSNALKLKNNPQFRKTSVYYCLVEVVTSERADALAMEQNSAIEFMEKMNLLKALHQNARKLDK